MTVIRTLPVVSNNDPIRFKCASLSLAMGRREIAAQKKQHQYDFKTTIKATSIFKQKSWVLEIGYLYHLIGFNAQVNK